MTAFVLRRLAWMAITLWIVFTVTFVLMELVPGGPLDSDRARDPAIQANLEAKYHLNDPVWKRYLFDLGNVLRGDLGDSYKMEEYSVNEIIAEGFPISAALGILALSFALVLGIVAGVTSAISRGSFFDVTLMSVATIGIAAPNFLIAASAILLFVFYWPIFPAAGWGTWRHLILPSLCLGAPYAADIARLMRTSMLDVQSQDYIRTARAKGLSWFTVIRRHALPAAMLPIVSFLGPAIAGIVTGSLVIEKIFAIPGLGAHFVEAALQRDKRVSMGVALLYTALVYLLNFAVDLCYAVIDPRVKVTSN